MNEIIQLDPTDLGLALGIIGVAIALSRFSNLELEGQFIIAAGRSILQLLVVGYVIAFIFALNNPLAVLGLLGLMMMIASIVARNRIGQKIKGLLPIVGGSLVVSTVLTLGYVLALIIKPDRWYDPQYLIPLTGMILGNAMNSASLAGERLSSVIEQNRSSIETHLCLGATSYQAISSYQKEAIRASLIPTLNQMMVVGLVSLPGMFTGQVLAGGDPLNAASYQILILFMIAFTNLLTAILITEGVYRRFFNANTQLV
ncbi:iron export ABC transporter permease subunit FetB [Aphanothece hegewaldii CCALA 016]|uniref:Iron export ABC transporter permease subunit FetB n=1 Tax=Aphanothece hegewaldii CCALA 016 TaxID=2107694 RepID=A0A2T1M0I8_9CHRO|nr:iron export ABC transporter permease subunit FetB [Aphanothece hegewaldii]PSF38189.1 iron export ABC transporter permease subunit FetB [Aphanothece hegewaldii CCALA 016]